MPSPEELGTTWKPQHRVLQSTGSLASCRLCLVPAWYASSARSSLPDLITVFSPRVSLLHLSHTDTLLGHPKLLFPHPYTSLKKKKKHPLSPHLVVLGFLRGKDAQLRADIVELKRWSMVRGLAAFPKDPSLNPRTNIVLLTTTSNCSPGYV